MASDSDVQEVTQGGGFIYVGGQSGFKPGAGDSFSEQIHRCLESIASILEDQGSSVEKLVKVTTYLRADKMTLEQYRAYGAAYNEFFFGRGIRQKPARSTIGVRFVEPEKLVEMEAIALV
jgi:enamine deaminase RidA (YjgF/YER057c/UK114 family)